MSPGELHECGCDVIGQCSTHAARDAANARLIAAAPEMKALLEMVVAGNTEAADLEELASTLLAKIERKE